MIKSSSVVQSFLKKSETIQINHNRAVRKIKDADVFLEIPLIRQSTDYSCGAASFLSILGYYGYDPHEKQIMKIMNTTLGGTDPQNFEKAATKFGLKTKIKDNMTFDEIRDNIKNKKPVVIAIQAWGNKKDYSKEWDEGHYVVVIGYDKKGFYLMDPSQMGYSYISERDLQNRWHDTMKKSDKSFINLGIIIYGKKPKFHFDAVHSID